MRLVVCLILANATPLVGQRPAVLSARPGTGPTFFERSVAGRRRIDIAGAAVLKRRVSLHVADAPIAQVLDSIAAQANLHVAYSPGIVNRSSHVTMQAEDLSVGAALTEVLMDAGLDVEIIGGDQLTVVERGARRQERRRVSGHVLDAESRSPVVGAQVAVAGTTIVTATTDSGAFVLRLPDGATTLAIRRIGYRQTTIAIPTDTNEITVLLARDVLKLDAMVVTGLATVVGSENAANDVAVINADEVSRVPAPTVEDALQGKVAGALIAQNNGGAPGGGMQVQVRGITSIYANAQPLYVVDGIMVNNETVNSGLNTITVSVGGVGPSQQDNSPNRIADLNPNDIETIEILKGASAAAIYGSKASSGVIVITTKHGRVGAPKWSLSGRAGHFELANRYDLRTFPTLTSAVDWGKTYGVDSAFIARNYAGPQDYQSQLFGNRELSYESDVSVSGTSGHTQYFLSGGAKYDNGILTNTGYSRQTVRANLAQHAGEALTVSADLSYANSVTRRGVSGNDNIGISPYDVLSYTPQFLALNHKVNGAWAVNPFGPANPFADAAEIRTPEAVNRFVGGGNVDWTVLRSDRQSLRLTVAGGGDVTTQQDKFYAPPDLQVEQQIPTGLPGVAQDQYGKTTYFNYSVNLIHHYTGLSFLDLTTSTGFSREQRAVDQPLTAGRELLAGVNNPQAGAVQTVEYFATDAKDQSLYFQEQLLTLRQRLLLTAGLTAERTTNDGNTGKYYPYTRFSASYRVPRFVSFVDELKLRAAYGQSGTQPNYGVKYTPFNIGVSNGAIGSFPPLAIGDPAIKPERETEIETGIDATVLHSRAQVNVTVYQKRLTDLLLLAATSPSLGFDEQWINGGEFTNQGIEVQLTATPIQARDGQWVTTASFYRNYSVVNALPVPDFNLAGAAVIGTYRIQVGRSVSQIVGNTNGPDGQPVQAGDGQPRFIMNFGNEVTVGPFRASAVVQWNDGGNASNFSNLLFDVGPGLLADTALSRRRLGEIGTTKIPYLEPAGFVKLREATVSYAVPGRWLRWTNGRIAGASLALTGRNLLMSTKYTGLDPEVTYLGNQQVARGFDVTPYPPARSYFLSLDLSL